MSDWKRLAGDGWLWYGETQNRKTRLTMPNTAEIIQEAESLPVEERALVVESLLRSLNPPDPETDKKWAAVAKRRLEELRSGRVKPVPGEEVFARIRQRFAA
jgi:putative addiction module component (TIGR02574 family)